MSTNTEQTEQDFAELDDQRQQQVLDLAARLVEEQRAERSA